MLFVKYFSLNVKNDQFFTIQTFLIILQNWFKIWPKFNLRFNHSTDDNNSLGYQISWLFATEKSKYKCNGNPSGT